MMVVPLIPLLRFTKNENNLYGWDSLLCCNLLLIYGKWTAKDLDRRGQMETAALIASCVSIGIAVFAVWLAITFYKMATKVSEGIKDAAKDISSGVNRLEKIFDRLYADTFGMVRDTFTDMRKHVWTGEKVTDVKVSEEAEKKAEEKIKKLKKATQQQLQETLARQKITNKKYEALSKDVSGLMDKIIASSRKVDSEAKEETLRSTLLDYIQHLPMNKSIRADKIVDEIERKYNFDVFDIVRELENFRNEGIITFKEETLMVKSNIKRIKII